MYTVSHIYGIYTDHTNVAINTQYRHMLKLLNPMCLDYHFGCKHGLAICDNTSNFFGANKLLVKRNTQGQVEITSN